MCDQQTKLPANQKCEFRTEILECKWNVSQDSFICESLQSSSDAGLNRCVPTQTQIRQQLGSKLSEIFFEYIGNEGKAYLGLEPPLVGPDTVWVNPKARLDNSVFITPVPEPAILHLKSFTHESILELGDQYVQKLENKHKLEMEEALRKQAEDLERECKNRIEALEEFTSGEGKHGHKRIVGTLMEHFDQCFNELVETMQLRMRRECQLKVEEERAEMGSYMLTQLQDAVERRDFELCEEFHDILYSELNILASRYVRQINVEREIAVQLIRETVRNYEKMMADLRIHMEMRSLVDICRAITTERKECSERIRELEKQNRGKLEEIFKYIEELKAENCTLQKMSTERLKRLMQWRQKVRELVQEFQRFINFSLKSVPGQSEFMLNVEKLMLRKFPEDSFLLPEDYIRFKNCIKKKLASDEDEAAIPEPKPSSEEALPLESLKSESSETGEGTPLFCLRSPCEEGQEPGLTFDYDLYRAIYLRKSMTKKPSGAKPKKAVCLWKKKTGEISIDKSNELYQMMTLAGEEERQHLWPADCFLQRRLKAVRRICQDDPEFATIFLGCPNN